MVKKKVLLISLSIVVAAGLFSLIILFWGVLFGNGETNDYINNQDIGGSGYCQNDIDCVPASVCHPKSCIPANEAKPSGMLCTQECAPGTLDCGQGSCACVNNRCLAVLD